MRNHILAALILTLPLAVTRMAAAQTPDEPAAAPSEAKPAPKAEAKAEAPAKAEPAAEAPAAKPAPKPAPKPEAKPEAEAPAAKPAPKPAPKPEPAKELTPAAKIFVPLADNYKRAYDELQVWILHIDAETAGVSARISRTQEDIQKNEAAITKLKLDGRDGSTESKELAKANKQLWTELSAARKERTELGKGFAREAIQRAKSYQLEIIEKLEAIKAQTK